MQEFKPVADWLGQALPRAERPAPAASQTKLAEVWREYWRGSGVQGAPLLFASGRLVVFVTAACWGNEIRHRAPRLQAALAAHGFHIQRVEVKHRPANMEDSPRP